MKILVLMPLDEKWSYAATAIYQALPAEIKNKTFAMPMFMEYAQSVGLAPHHDYAVFDALVGVKSVYRTALAENDDLIVLGNCSATYDFDAVFNFQDIEEDLPYEDRNIMKLRAKVKDDEVLAPYLNNLHVAAESQMALHNCVATADFLTKYLTSAPQLDKIEKEFSDSLKHLNKELYKNLDTIIETIKEVA